MCIRDSCSDVRRACPFFFVLDLVRRVSVGDMCVESSALLRFSEGGTSHSELRLVASPASLDGGTGSDCHTGVCDDAFTCFSTFSGRDGGGDRRMGFTRASGLGKVAVTSVV